MSNTFVVIERFAISFLIYYCVTFAIYYKPFLPTIYHLTVTLLSNISLLRIFFSINLQLLLPLHISFPFISCFAHKKVITLFSFWFYSFFWSIFFFFSLLILSCISASGWSGLVFCFLIPPSLSLSWLWSGFSFS